MNSVRHPDENQKKDVVMRTHGNCLVIVSATARGLLITCLLIVGPFASLVAAAPASDEEGTRARLITEQADKIVSQLGIADEDKAARVRDLLVDQYQSLGRIHDEVDAKIASAKNRPGDSTVAQAWIKTVENQAKLQLFTSHRQFVASLAAELTPDEVDQVKNGMTYGVAPSTYRRYLKLLPELTEQQKVRILAWLIEAREYAMDAGSEEASLRWFDKYKGRIDGYLAAAGHDLKRAEDDRAGKPQSALPSR